MKDVTKGKAGDEILEDSGENLLQLPKSEPARQTGEHISHHHQHHHMAHMDPLLMTFFVLNDLKLGKTMPLYFPYVDPSKSLDLLPKEKPDSVPFSPNSLPYLLQFFSISQDSPQAKAIEETLRICQDDQSINVGKGETKYCATSLETLVGQASKIFRSDTGVQILMTSHTSKTKTTASTPVLQNYTIVGKPKEIAAPNIIACHSMSYPYAVYYCHNPEGDTKVFEVTLLGEIDGDRIDAVSVCHMDTSQWDPHHVSFSVLGVLPGSSEVCHFFPPGDNLLLLPYY
ncbi:hypothetical protein CCACVL1_25050 [Corchorus capsularis]|uniref:BURP domain-containing protein n=1 Tax=Corchorus capsularis TaxID=210143 RepID=A0A1R3GM73_COCAP|nr:hypothetical protein CCACVL1_25050 [Corchorus capsularis]